MSERTLTDADVEAIARAVEERLRGKAANDRPRAARRRRVASPEAVERAAERARRYAR